jgi:flagellar L-ring protein precursor FlgH
MRSVVVVMFVLATGVAAYGQSSSLYLAPAKPFERVNGELVNPALQHASYTAVIPLPPRKFALHDLVTIVVRESSNASSEGKLETSKELEVEGEISDFPSLQLKDLLQFRLKGGALTSPSPKLGVSYSNEYTGDGNYERKDEIVFRITARVVDVKPNGTLALEARKHIENDDEKLTISLTGFCRPEDVAADNTVLSTQMFDLRVNKQHQGEVRNAQKKGLLTKLLDFVFNF